MLTTFQLNFWIPVSLSVSLFISLWSGFICYGITLTKWAAIKETPGIIWVTLQTYCHLSTSKKKKKKICFVIFTNLANSSWDLWQIGIITYGSGWKKGVENQHLEFGTWELTSGCSIHNNQNTLTPVRQTRWWSTPVQAVKYTLQVLSLVSAFAAVRNYPRSSWVWTAWP